MSELLERALEAGRARRAEARDSGIELIGVFGSVARGDANPDSDVDYAYDIIGPASLFDVGGLLMTLKEDLQRRVDLVDISQVKERLRRAIERDLVRL